MKAYRIVVFDMAQFGGLGMERPAAYQGNSRLQPSGSSPMQHHPWQDDALNAGLYTTGMRLFWKYTGTRIRKVLMCSRDRKLDHWNMGTFSLVQISFEVLCKMETVTKLP
jgi:hypothetical protein